MTTDFGTRDSYVAAMKGVILAIAGAARLVDVTHDVAAHDVTEAALALEAVVPFFPSGAVHLAVVDPGVGTDRRGLAVAAGDAFFVGPDNGIFTPVLEGPDWRAFELTAPKYRLPEVSRTFHGRDVFAPAAAHLALGLSPERLGPRVDDPVRLHWPTVREAHGAVAGTVLHVDRFGNLVTSVRAETFAAFGPVTVRIAGRALPFVGTYGDLTEGQAGALVGGSGRLEIAVREGSAAARLKARRGTPVVVSRLSAVRRVRRR
ncbi:MAG TPA: SAM-dependent chlorinase/fluorinase [Methylomirabilota bacterium]|nr:SAM-dependent chlorinase/fluorinase [Methylomirabilota bacterium]